MLSLKAIPVLINSNIGIEMDTRAKTLTENTSTIETGDIFHPFFRPHLAYLFLYSDTTLLLYLLFVNFEASKIKTFATTIPRKRL